MAIITRKYSTEAGEEITNHEGADVLSLERNDGFVWETKDNFLANLAGTERTTETVKGNADAIATVKVKTTKNDLAIADIRRDQTLANQSEAKISVSDYGIVALPKNATGNLKLKREGLTARNIVNGASVAIGGTVTFALVLNDIYYDTLHKVQITGTGSDIIITNDSGAIANMAIINLTQTFSSVPTLAQCKNIFPTYFADTKNVPMTGRYRGTDLDGVTTHDQYFTAPEGRSVPSAKDSVEVVDGRLVHVQNVGVGALGEEKVTNGGFDTDTAWVKSGVTIEDGVAKIANAGYVYQNIHSVISVGALCKISYDVITTNSTGTLRLTAGGSPAFNISGLSITLGHHEYYAIRTTGIDLIILSVSGFAGNIDNVSVKEIVTTTGAPLAIASQDQVSDDGTNGYYQLATPITTPIDSDGSLPAGASVYWEPAIPDVGIYTTKFDILDTDHPIASIDKLYKVDFSTGVQTQLTDAVVAGDGLSFTSASLTDGDLVNVIYYYATANPEGLTTAEYLNSNVVVADSANGKYYKYKPVITNGAIASWTLTEVV